MWKAKIIKMPETSMHWLKKHKIGDIIEIGESQYSYQKQYLEGIEHYRYIHTKKTCTECGQIIKKQRTKIPWQAN